MSSDDEAEEDRLLFLPLSNPSSDDEEEDHITIISRDRGVLRVDLDRPYLPGVLSKLACRDRSDKLAWQQQLLRRLIDHFGSGQLVLICPCGKHADTARRLVPGGPFVVDKRGTINVRLVDALHVAHSLTYISITDVRREDLSSIPVRGVWSAWYSLTPRRMNVTVIAPPDYSITVTIPLL